MDHDPRNPTYIASQGPLASTVADFWQVRKTHQLIRWLPFIFQCLVSAAMRALKEHNRTTLCGTKWCVPLILSKKRSVQIKENQWSDVAEVMDT